MKDDFRFWLLGFVAGILLWSHALGCSALLAVLTPPPDIPGEPQPPVVTATATPAASATATATASATVNATSTPTVAPRPKPTPEICPPLVKVGVSPLGNYFRDREGRSCTWLDATPRFACKFCPRSDGCPINAEHHECGTVDGKNDSPWRQCEPSNDGIRYVIGKGVTSIFAPRHNPDDPAQVYHTYQVAICGRLGVDWVVSVDLEQGAVGADGRLITRQWGEKPTVLRGRFK